MSAKPTSGQPSAGADPTLGELLDASRGDTRVPESDWVALVTAVAAQDHAALHALYERTHHIVFTLITRITGDRSAAEELTLDVFEQIWRQASRYNPEEGTVLGWIMNQARCRATDQLQFEQGRSEPRPRLEAAMSSVRSELKELGRALDAGAHER